MVKSKIIWMLVWVNVALLVGLALKLTSPVAQAQFRRPSEYVMIPGEITGGTSAAVYIVDTTQGRMAAISFDDGSGRLSTMPWIDLNQTFQTAVGPERAPGF
jgi:hypothetical protein